MLWSVLKSKQANKIISLIFNARWYFCLLLEILAILFTIFYLLIFKILIISILLFQDSHFLRKFLTIVTEFHMLSCKLISTFYSVIFVPVTFGNIIHKAGY